MSGKDVHFIGQLVYKAVKAVEMLLGVILVGCAADTANKESIARHDVTFNHDTD